MIETLDLEQKVAVGDGILHILKGINLSINAGETVAIIGASGSGKSTLLGMLAGLDIPSSGKVFLKQQEITELDEEGRAKIRSELVSFVFQNFQLLSSLNALENVMLPLELKGADGAEARAKHYLERVGLSERQHHYPNQLSGGEQQRVSIARAFACEAPIIFADEPTGNLDNQTGDKIADLLFELNTEHAKTLVLVTHSPALAQRCGRQLEMTSGRLTDKTVTEAQHGG